MSNLPIARAGVLIVLLTGASHLSALPDYLDGREPTSATLEDKTSATERIGQDANAAFDWEQIRPSRYLHLWREQLIPETRNPFVDDMQFSLRPRFYYFHRKLDPGSTMETAAAGGSLSVESGWWRDRIRLGMTGYGSWKMHGPRSRDGLGFEPVLFDSVQGVEPDRNASALTVAEIEHAPFETATARDMHRGCRQERRLTVPVGEWVRFAGRCRTIHTQHDSFARAFRREPGAASGSRVLCDLDIAHEYTMPSAARIEYQQSQGMFSRAEVELGIETQPFGPQEVADFFEIQLNLLLEEVLHAALGVEGVPKDL